jgi:hypothetical protein
VNKISSLLAATLLIVSFAPPAPAGDSHECKVHCVEPSTACSESEQVVETLKAMIKALTTGDLNAYESYLDEGCTTFDERTKKLIVGKQAVIEDMKAKFQRYGPDGVTPLLSYTIDHPYARVTGDTAVVTFVAMRELGGPHPVKEKSHVTDVFVKHDGKWKKLHYRGMWKRV